MILTKTAAATEIQTGLPAQTAFFIASTSLTREIVVRSARKPFLSPLVRTDVLSISRNEPVMREVDHGYTLIPR